MHGGSTGFGRRSPRAVDGIVAGAQAAGTFEAGKLPSTWVLVARGDESVDEFFLESPFGGAGRSHNEDPVAWICRGVRPDGRVLLGAVDLAVDLFVSEVLDQDERRAR